MTTSFSVYYLLPFDPGKVRVKLLFCSHVDLLVDAFRGLQLEDKSLVCVLQTFLPEKFLSFSYPARNLPFSLVLLAII